jgi:hypothetical protein
MTDEQFQRIMYELDQVKREASEKGHFIIITLLLYIATICGALAVHFKL